MLWAIMGVGMLFNAIQQNSQNAQMREMQQAQQAETKRMMKSLSAQRESMADNNMADMLHMQTGLPEFPQENFSNLQNLQLGHADARQAFASQLDSDLQSAKTAFFENNHYETRFGADGRQEVATENGKPLVKDGPETADKKTVRLGYESNLKSELNDKHSSQKEQFLNKERENFKEFLAMNREQLNNPYVQNELQRMVVNTKKKSLELQQNQEDERWRVDMPPSEEIAAKLDSGLKQLREMDQKHVQEEENSPDAQALVEHDQQVAAVLYDRKQQARQEKERNNDFMMDPRRMMAAVAQRSQPIDVGQALPSYLSNAMYDLGVYTV
jgi:hypothetical protein